MTDIKAKNVGSIINSPNAPVNITNIFNADSDISLPLSIPSPKGFVGREDELNTLREAKARGISSFVLHGAGGVGKTDLALKFIEEVKTHNQKTYQVNMFGLSKNSKNWKDVMTEVITSFEPNTPPDLSEEDIKKFYNGLLNKYRPVLFFDNTENREQVENLNNSSALIIITSRTIFNVSGGYSTEVKPMSKIDARTLLYTIVEENRFAGEVDNLTDLAGYLPMALLPLAALLAEDITLEAKDLVLKYSNRKESLKLSDPNRENLSVEASFDLSYEALSDELKIYWQMLSVFSSDFDLKAMEAIWQIEDGKEVRSELIRRHLLEFDQDSKRSQFHDLARLYAKEKSNPEIFDKSAFHHSVYFARYLHSLNEMSLSNLAKFDIERINIEQGFNWVKNRIGYDNSLVGIYLSYIDVPTEILSIRLHPRELIDWLEIGLNVVKKIGLGIGEGMICCNLAFAYQHLGKYREAIAYGEKASETAKKFGDLKTESTALNNQGNSYQSLGKIERAIQCFEESLDVANKINDSVGQASCLCNLGISYGILGEYKIAAGFCLQSLDIATQIDSIYWKSLSTGNLGIIYKNLQEYEKAMNFHEQALEIARQMGDRKGICMQLGCLANLYSSLDNYQKSIDFFNQSYEMAKEIGDLKQEGICLGNLGIAFYHLGDSQKAEDYFYKAVVILDSIEVPEANQFRRNLSILRRHK